MSDLSPLFSDCLIASAFIKPETVVFDTPEIYKVVNESSPYGFLNGIYRTHFAVRDADRLIHEHDDSYRSRKISYRWYVFEHSRPGDLESKLQALGPKEVVGLEGLAISSEEARIGVPAGVTVEVVGAHNVEEYAEAVVAGWQQSGTEAESVRRDIRRDVADPKCAWTGFLARYRGEPASTGMIRFVGPVGYLQGASTNPKFRGKGVYRGLVAARLEFLKQRKISQALILARTSSSAPICRRLGFKAVSGCNSYDFNF